MSYQNAIFRILLQELSLLILVVLFAVLLLFSTSFLFIGLHPNYKEDLCCPASRPKKDSGISNRDISGFVDGNLPCLMQGPGATPHSVRQKVGRAWWQSSLPKGRGGSSYRGIDFRWAHQLPEKPVEEQTPHCPFDKNYHQLGPGTNMQEGQSCEEGIDEASPSQAGDVQRAGEQPY